MQKSKGDKLAAIKTAVGSMGLMVLTIVSFIVLLWIVIAVIRVVIGLLAATPTIAS